MAKWPKKVALDPKCPPGTLFTQHPDSPWRTVGPEGAKGIEVTEVIPADLGRALYEALLAMVEAEGMDSDDSMALAWYEEEVGSEEEG